MKVCLRLGLVSASWSSPGIGSAEAARITLEPGGEGAGTIVNDGSDDVRSSNMSATGNTDLLTCLWD